MSDLNSKKCTKCKEIKDLTSFKSRKRNDKVTYLSKCKECYSEYDQQWATLNVKKVRHNRLMSNHNMTFEQYQTMLIQQRHVCQICKQPEIRKSHNGVLRSLSVDHCHKTGKIRGLLCDACNTAIGLLQDSVDNALALTEYLKMNESK